ncbi:hypothetical protein B0H14DRAFT_3089447 [Mycena olivaceomarginata]|nr:hypothetical protein B0H14DRAFT_3089447 [Mycena olivaceomarginata]
MPCAPWKPTVAITVCVLETYRVTHVRCPHLAIQAFVKALCDIQGVPYRPYLCQQFSIAYDLYLDIRRRTDKRVMKALGRDSTWRMKHACPACMYRLEGEDALIFEMLTTMDGNDSLKRVLRRDKSSVGEDETGELTLAKSREQEDSRDASNGYYISRDRVDRWAKSRLGDRLPMQTENADEDNPCAERWKNMINDVTSKIQVSSCQHGFVLVITDMIKSGELAKYPLAVVKELLGAFGMKLGAGYDMGCHFQATVANSELGPEARDKGLKCLVGSFHGHAHNRLCQLRFLATYVEGMGLEDLERCERFFSRSNGLAKSCRYTSRFHCQQEITTYAKQFDSFETYANLSKFLCNNYRQALGILKTEPALRAWMRQEAVDSMETFHEWLEEEKSYLVGLKAAPKTNTETLEMEYVQKLQRVMELTAEMARRHAQEKAEKDLEQVQELESTLASPKWVETVAAIKQRKYQLALNALELLIMERIFELTKMNQSETALTWEEVVEYAFLTDFDILRDTRAEVQSRPWTRLAYCLAMDRDFKTLRAREEIKRLDIEIRRVVTWIWDENRFLRLAAKPGFMGSLKCGVAVEQKEVEKRLQELQVELARTGQTDGMEVDGSTEETGAAAMLDPGTIAADAAEVTADARRRGAEVAEDDEGDEARDEAVAGLLYRISMLATDDMPQDRAEE